MCLHARYSHQISVHMATMKTLYTKLETLQGEMAVARAARLNQDCIGFLVYLMVVKNLTGRSNNKKCSNFAHPVRAQMSH